MHRIIRDNKMVVGNLYFFFGGGECYTAVGNQDMRRTTFNSKSYVEDLIKISN